MPNKPDARSDCCSLWWIKIPKSNVCCGIGLFKSENNAVLSQNDTGKMKHTDVEMPSKNQEMIGMRMMTVPDSRVLILLKSVLLLTMCEKQQNVATFEIFSFYF